MSVTRRALVAAAAAAPLMGQAQAQDAPLPDWLRTHSAMSAWDPPERPSERLLNSRVEPEPGASRITVREWLGGRPGVLAVWATWCPPCLAEKRDEAMLSARLQAAGANAQIKALLAFDRSTLAESDQRLQSLGASQLDNARAAESAEQALLWTFGFERDRRSMNRTSSVLPQLSTTLPFTLLLDANGALLGTMTSRITDRRGRAYWSRPDVFEMLQRLGSA